MALVDKLQVVKVFNVRHMETKDFKDLSRMKLINSTQLMYAIFSLIFCHYRETYGNKFYHFILY